MRTILRFGLATALAGTLIATMAASASALRSLSINERSVHVNLREWAFTESGGLGFRCSVTLRVVLNTNSIAKTTREVGNVAAAPSERCRDTLGFSASMTPLVEERAPWLVLYNGFTGTLPAIRALKLILRAMKFLVRDSLAGIECLYEGDTEGFATVEGGVISTFTMEPARSLPVKTELRSGCPTPLRFSGSGSVVRLRDLTGGGALTLI
jgi:hypothetical protein